ncbi:hypothetical protein TDB9533_04464 [Thalassocella blandensis]|nr:hypothetical protein TDB9533_04464 [Thalassocella blandensis]
MGKKNHDSARAIIEHRKQLAYTGRLFLEGPGNRGLALQFLARKLATMFYSYYISLITYANDKNINR